MGRKSVETERKKKQPRGCLGRFLLFLVVVEGLILAAGIGAFLYLNSVLDLVERPQAKRTAIFEKLEDLGESLSGKNDGIVNILLIGQDMREGADHKLADAMILCSVNRNTGTMTMCSLMRDMYVQLPDYAGHAGSKNRINAAYSLGCAWNGDRGGMEMLDQLILEQFGVEVDYNVEFSFDSFVCVVDALGGVELDLTEAEAAYLNKQPNLPDSYTEGSNLLDGEAALIFVRTRHSSAGDSDFLRTGRQRAVVAAVTEKLRKMDFQQLHTMITDILPMIYTDMTNREILSCALKLLPMAADLKIESQQIPADGTYENARVEIGGYSAAVLVPDLERNKQILMEICEG